MGLRATRVAALLVFTLAGAAWATSPPGPFGTPEDEAAIHQLVVAYQEAWNKKDAKAIGDLFAVDADFSSIYGQSLHSRATIAEKHGVLFTGPQKESQQTRPKSEVKIRFLRPDVASVDSISEIVGVIRGDGTKSSSNRALTNFILVKNESKWEIAIFHNMLLPAIPTQIPQAPTAPAPGAVGE